MIVREQTVSKRIEMLSGVLKLQNNGISLEIDLAKYHPFAKQL